MAFLTLFMRRQLPQAVSYFVRAVKLGRPGCGGAPLRRLHASGRQRIGEKGPWGKNLRGPEQPLQQYQLTDLDKADASVGRIILRTKNWVHKLEIIGDFLRARFLSWFRNGLLATGIGVIAFVQSEVGREAGYAFFILGGACVLSGGAFYIWSLFALRRLMLLSVPALLFQGGVVGSIVLLWLCAVSLYTGRLEVEIIHEDEEEGGEDEGECQECRERREHRGYRGSQDSEDSGSKGRNK